MYNPPEQYKFPVVQSVGKKKKKKDLQSCNLHCRNVFSREGIGGIAD